MKPYYEEQPPPERPPQSRRPSGPSRPSPSRRPSPPPPPHPDTDPSGTTRRSGGWSLMVNVVMIFWVVLFLGVGMTVQGPWGVVLGSVAGFLMAIWVIAGGRA